MITLPKTNIAPENQWWEDDFPLGMPIFMGYVRFREGSSHYPIGNVSKKRIPLNYTGRKALVVSEIFSAK